MPSPPLVPGLSRGIHVSYCNRVRNQDRHAHTRTNVVGTCIGYIIKTKKQKNSWLRSLQCRVGRSFDPPDPPFPNVVLTFSFLIDSPTTRCSVPLSVGSKGGRMKKGLLLSVGKIYALLKSIDSRNYGVLSFHYLKGGCTCLPPPPLESAENWIWIRHCGSCCRGALCTCIVARPSSFLTCFDPFINGTVIRTVCTNIHLTGAECPFLITNAASPYYMKEHRCQTWGFLLVGFEKESGSPFIHKGP